MTEPQTERAVEQRGAPEWARLAMAAAVAQIAGAIVIQAVLAGTVIPPLVILPLLLIVGIVLQRPRERVGTIVIGVGSLLLLAGNIPFVASDLGHPESFLPFVVMVVMLLGSLVAINAAVAYLLGASARPARRVAEVAVGLVLLSALFGAVSAMRADDTTARAGDLPVSAKNIEFEPAALRADAGRVSVHVDNGDLVHHNFTIDELDVALDVPAGRQRRTAFDAARGRYEFTCTVVGHEDMKGRLTVE